MDLVVVLKNEGILLGLCSFLPEGDLAGLTVESDLSRLLTLEAKAIEDKWGKVLAR